ncbi:PEP-CTERM sorting domain-containing protein [Roseomonas elaeocarpi]|uniref:PEP-CTERM sorting domain-containing protein n=1 Tax=Roseomonas elaeocarpi TaxID=907779 RepID=A0ABV6JWV3_9PROT
MRKALLAASALIGLAMTPAMAAPITGTFNIAGAGSCTTTACTFIDFAPTLNGNAIIGSVSGSYTAAGFTSGSGATINNFTYSPFTPGTVYTAFSVSNTSGNQASFQVTGQISATYTPIDGSGANLTIVNSGTAFLTGYDPTPGFYTFTQNQFGDTTGTFSASSVAVPEPASIALFGVGLLGLAVARRRARGA